MKEIAEYIYLLFSILIGMIGYTINHNDMLWGIIDFLFAPIALIKWLICHEITLNIIKQSFIWFLN